MVVHCPRTGQKKLKQTLRLLCASLVGLCLLIGNQGAHAVSASLLGYQTFIDTSGQLVLNDILSNRYANLFVPSTEGPVKVPGGAAALWRSEERRVGTVW